MVNCRWFRLGTLLGALAVVCTGVAAGQATAPLRKTDLVRLLTNPSLTKAQIAERIRGACLAFDPTGRDRVDLQALGANAVVMAQIDNCVRKKAAAAKPAAPPAVAAGAQPPAPRPAAPRPTAAPVAAAGRPTAAPVRPTAPAAGRPATAQPRPTAPAPTPTAPAPGATVPGPPGAVDVQPARLEVRPGEPAGRRVVTVTVRDAQGNAVPGERVEFRPSSPDLGIGAFSGQTSRSGQLSATLSTATLKRNGEIGIFVRGARLGSLGIVIGSVVISEARTRFLAADSLRGVAGRTLAQPLVIEVRDTTGMPVAGQTVNFAATNGTVTPASAVTDAKGQASVSAVLGRQAGKALIAASAGAIRKEVTVAVGPGPAGALVVKRDTARVARTLVLQSTRPVLLQVTAQDSFGNNVPATGLRANVREAGVLRVARVDVVGGTARVELRAQASGSAQIELAAAGVRQTLPAQVLLPVAGGGWSVAWRAGWTGFDYHFHAFALRGRPGPVGELVLGRSLGGGIRVATVITFAKLALDTAAVHAPVTLLNGSLRLEYSMLPRASIHPVMTVGGGQFQTRVPVLQGLGRHTSLFWLAGLGFDFPVRERLTLEVRAATQQLHQSKTQFAEAGRVGALTAFTVGFRFGN